LGIPKPDSDALRPLAIGELFLKLAAKYCHDMDKGEHTGIFEPIQLALDSPSGAERAMQRVQAAIEASPTEHITLHLDCTNAFNTVDRAAMLSAVFGDQRLSSSWHVYSFAYGNPSSLLVRDHGHVAGSISSVRGVKQGCVLGSLGFARVMQPVYEACVAGLAVSAVAIMDDFTLTGPPAAVFSAFDRFVDLVRPLGIEVNSTKTKVQQAAGEPSELTAQLAADRGLEVVRGNHKCLGGLVGVDDQAAVAWLEAKLAKQTPVTRALRDSRFPSLLALQLAKISNIPKPMYLLRAMPLRITLAPITAFDQRNRHVLLPRLLRSSNPLPSSALVSLTQPAGNGGLGLRELACIAPAARWASAAAAAPDLQRFGDAGSLAPLPFMLDRDTAFGMLVQSGVQRLAPGQPEPEDSDLASRLRTLPLHPNEIILHYEGIPKLKGLQRELSQQILNHRLHTFLESAECTNSDVVRLASCRHKTTQRWMQPSPSSPLYTDLCTTIVTRLRLGLPPLDDIPETCPLCKEDVTATPWHALSCAKLKRKTVTRRHDRCCQLLCRFARSNDCTAHVVQKDLAHLLPDGEIHMFSRTVDFDVSGVNPHTPSYVDMAPGEAMTQRERYKIGKYAAHSEQQGRAFAPFVLDAYGCLAPAALQLIKDIRDESLSFGAPHPFRLSRSSFLAELSRAWQFDNAKIVVQWMTLVRNCGTRLPLPPFPPAQSPAPAPVWADMEPPLAQGTPHAHSP